MTLELTKAQTAELIESARREMVERLMIEYRGAVTLLSVQQTAGLLDCNPKTLLSMGIPRVVLVPNKVIKYRLADLQQFIQDNLEK